MAEKIPETRFLIVGDGILKDDVAAEAKRRGVNFVFAGLVPPGEVGRYIALADVMIHLSLREGLPRSVVQSLAAGVPAVTFELDGAPEVVIPGETGFLAPPGDAESAASATLKILQDGELRKSLGTRGRELVAEMFDWRKMGDILEREYEAGIAENQ